MPRRLPILTSEILRDKRILAVGYDDDVLEVIDEELSFGGCNVTIQGSATLEDALHRIVSNPYDLVIFDVESVVCGVDLVRIAQKVGIPTVILTSRAFTPEDLKKSVAMGARAYLPLDTLGSLIPVLEDVIELYRRKRTDGGFWREFWTEFEREPAVRCAELLCRSGAAK